jgi:hypothetical protein
VTPAKLKTTKGGMPQARARRKVAEKYLEVADLIGNEDGLAINVCIGVAVLAGIAAGDAICLAATGERYSGQDHSQAATLLGRVDAAAGKHLSKLVDFKPGSHYGDTLLQAQDRTSALRAAKALVENAHDRIA